MHLTSVERPPQLGVRRSNEGQMAVAVRAAPQRPLPSLLGPKRPSSRVSPCAKPGATSKSLNWMLTTLWLGCSSAAGANSRKTDDWVFKGVRPRVDVNAELRGPYHWLKAAQRGHFYCSVHKTGALFTSTNYPPWQGLWVPEASWGVSLYRQHKLGHDKYLQLSALLRDGHERRKASVEAVRATEQANDFAQERAWAREQIRARACPFKMLQPAVERWMMSFEEVEERYCMLVSHGPSRTGKSRLARSLFGMGRTLVVDVQQAKHPDLRTFRRHVHRALLLDEVADPSFVVNNKKLLQAHVDGAILGHRRRRTSLTKCSFGVCLSSSRPTTGALMTSRQSSRTGWMRTAWLYTLTPPCASPLANGFARDLRQ